MVTTATTRDTGSAASGTRGDRAATPASADHGDIYVDILRTLDDARLAYIVGGTHALAHFTRGGRDDAPPAGKAQVVVRPDDQRKVLNALVHAGFRAEYVCPVSTARVTRAADGRDAVDVVYGSANGLCTVDDDWFRFAISGDVSGHPVRICPPEELLWREAFVQERESHHGADVARLILRQGRTFDWQRLLRRFHGHERVLLAHCVLFGYVYPTEQSCVPDWVLDYLNAAVRHEAEPHVKLCRGTLLAPDDYAAEISSHEFADGRLKPHGPLSAADLELVSQTVCPDQPASDAVAGPPPPSPPPDGVNSKRE
jgi:hypothetical protein